MADEAQLSPDPRPVTRSVFYHRTTAEAAAAILANGFRDGAGTYGVSRETEGVWLSDVPLDVNEGAEGDVLLAIETPDPGPLAAYEWIEEKKPYREWQVPAAWLNAHGSVRRVSEEEEDTITHQRFVRRNLRKWCSTCHGLGHSFSSVAGSTTFQKTPCPQCGGSGKPTTDDPGWPPPDRRELR